MKISYAYRLIGNPKAGIELLHMPDDVIDGGKYETETEIELAILTTLLSKGTIHQSDIQNLELTWKLL